MKRRWWIAYYAGLLAYAISRAAGIPGWTTWAGGDAFDIAICAAGLAYFIASMVEVKRP